MRQNVNTTGLFIFDFILIMMYTIGLFCLSRISFECKQKNKHFNNTVVLYPRFCIEILRCKHVDIANSSSKKEAIMPTYTLAAISPSISHWKGSEKLWRLLGNHVGGKLPVNLFAFPRGSFFADQLQDRLRNDGCDLVFIGELEYMINQSSLYTFLKDFPEVPVFFVHIESVLGEPALHKISWLKAGEDRGIRFVDL